MTTDSITLVKVLISHIYVKKWSHKITASLLSGATSITIFYPAASPHASNGRSTGFASPSALALPTCSKKIDSFHSYYQIRGFIWHLQQLDHPELGAEDQVGQVPVGQSCRGVVRLPGRRPRLFRSSPDPKFVINLVKMVAVVEMVE